MDDVRDIANGSIYTKEITHIIYSAILQQFQFQSTNAINIHRQHNKYGLKMTQKVWLSFIFRNNTKMKLSFLFLETFL